MWRHAIILALSIAGGVSLLACGGGVALVQPAATDTVEATATVESGKLSSPQPCPPNTPSVSLRYNDQQDDGRRISTNWSADGCNVSAHPFNTIPLPTSILMVPAGARPVLAFTEIPISAVGIARPLPVDKIASYASGIHIFIDDLYANPTVAFDLQAAVEQKIELGALAPGEWFLQLNAEWPGGRMGFVFRIEIVE